GLAKALMGGTVAPVPGQVFAPAHVALIELTAPTLVNESKRVSTALETEIRNPAVHEAAALVLAGFALRESANRSNDPRWAMNRPTPHLSLAAALRAGDSGVDGLLAEAVGSILSGHQRRALQIVDRLDTPSATAAERAWIRALRLRVTEDWRLVPSPH